MPHYSETSLRRLESCDDRLQEIFKEVIEVFDVTILEGHRGQHKQEEMFAKGTSTLHYPESKHNRIPSRAVDVAPYPINWQDKRGFFYLAGIVMGIAHQKGYKVRWGGDWNSNGNFDDQSFDDLPHFEILD